MNQRHGGANNGYPEGALEMATKSVLKSIHVKDRRQATNLVRALESAKGKAATSVIKNRSFSDVDRSEIRRMFGESK